MLRIRSHVGVLSLFALLALVVGCGGGEQVDSAARDEQWAALEAEHRALNEARAEITDLRARMLEVGAAEAAEPAATDEDATEEGAMDEEATEALTVEGIQAQIDQLEAALITQAEDFGMHLVEFINADPVYQGEEPTPRQKAAFGLKSSEDIILGQEYIDKGGDYRRAIEIFEAARLIDPENQNVIAALEKAKGDRFMTEDRFSQISEGMGQDQVVALLGQVYHHNMRDYPEKEVIAWFYPKEEGGAAGVYFQLHKESETYQVYRVDFHAVKSATEAGEEGEEVEPDAP